MVVHQELRLLATAAKNIRIAALEADHPALLHRQLHQQFIGVFLGHVMAAAGLADMNAFGRRVHQFHDLGRHQAVIHNGIGLLYQHQRPQGQQAGISRACSHDGYLSGP